MRHLVNLISHFPANSVPTHTYTSLQECHDLLDADKPQEMSREIFNSPNLQMFVHNKSTLITVMEMEKVRMVWYDVNCQYELLVWDFENVKGGINPPSVGGPSLIGSIACVDWIVLGF